MKAHNIMEEIVKNYIDDILAKNDEICKCNKCIDEIMAQALSNLPAKYITTDRGAMHTLMEQVRVEQSSEILKELMNGITYLQKHPIHQ